MELIRHFSIYWKEAPFDTFLFWIIPVGTFILIWLFTIVGLKIFRKRKRLKTVFMVNRAWIVASLILSSIIIGIICYCWTQNIFAEHPYQLSLLFSLTIAMSIPIFSFINLRKYYSSENVKEIVDQPKTLHQLNTTIPLIKKAFYRSKRAYLISILGFLLLLFYLNKGVNLISIVYDNSGSMSHTNAIEALSETFDKLEDNNEIILTTLNGPQYQPKVNAKTSLPELMAVRNSSALFAGNISSFQNPAEAVNAINQVTGYECCSPICESIWKTYLFIKESKNNEDYKHKLLIVITDGYDSYLEESLKTDKFFFDDTEFSEYFPSENVFIIDFSESSVNTFLQKCTNAGCDVYPAENNKQDYLDGLDNALQSFKNNWYLIYWTLLIFSVLAIIGLLIPPKKII